MDDSLYGTDQAAGVDQLVKAITEGIRALAALASGSEFERGFEFRWGYHPDPRLPPSIPGLEPIAVYLFGFFSVRLS